MLVSAMTLASLPPRGDTHAALMNFNATTKKERR
jgi:hypothetical protein